MLTVIFCKTNRYQGFGKNLAFFAIKLTGKENSQTEKSACEFSFSIMLLASPRRFERPTYCLGGSCSILLSYGDIFILMRACAWVDRRCCASLAAACLSGEELNKLGQKHF
jgi:hypothetical protein